MIGDRYISQRELLGKLAENFFDIDYQTRLKIENKINQVKAVDLLDRDTGKEPILEEGSTLLHVAYTNGKSGFENRPYLDWKCPTCGYFVGELYCGNGMWHIQQEQSYCPKCGQKIDWTKPSAEEKERYESRKAKEREEFQQKNGVPCDNMFDGRRKKYGVK